MKGISGALGILYMDRLDVRRHEPVVSGDMSTSMRLIEEPVLKGVPCRISYRGHYMRGIDSPGPGGEDFIAEILQPKVFCPPDTDVRKGDIVTVYRRSGGKTMDTLSGPAGRCAVYPTHREFLIDVRGEA